MQNDKHETRSSRKRKTTEPEKGKCVGLGGISHQQHAKCSNLRQEAPPSANMNNEQTARPGGFQFFEKHKNFITSMATSVKRFSHTHSSHHRVPYPSKIEFYRRNAPFHFSGHDMGPSSTMTRLPCFVHDPGMYMGTRSLYHGYNHRNYTHQVYSHPNHDFNLGIPGTFHEFMTVDRSSS